MSSLDFVLLLLGSVVVAITAARSFKLPPVIAYLIVGCTVAISTKVIVPNAHDLDELAEMGIVLLMFTVGLEFSLSQLVSMKRTVFGLGGLQVLITFLLTAIVVLLLGFEWRIAICIGFIISMSSTAIVGKMLAERLEMNSAHGREIFGIAMFQDIAVVPMLIILPALKNSSDNLALELLFALTKSIIALALILKVGQPLIRRWFDIVAQKQSQELFVLNVLFVCVGLAWISNTAGLSMELGALLAGVLISETEYRHQVEDDIKPFRDVLLGLFFVTIGMKLNPQVLIGELLYVVIILVTMTTSKFTIILGLSRFFGQSPPVAIRTALWLSSAGEFGFILLSLCDSLHLLTPEISQPLLAASLLSMLITPMIIHHSDKIVLRISHSEWLHRSRQLTQIVSHSIAKSNHVILVGFGRHGQAIARMLENEYISYVAIDLNPDNIKMAHTAGQQVVYGDASRKEILIAAGVQRARTLVISTSVLALSTRIMQQVKNINPKVPVIVRAREVGDIQVLLGKGATEVVSESLETSLVLSSHVMALMGIPFSRVVQRIRDVRKTNYTLFHEMYGNTENTTDESNSTTNKEEKKEEDDTQQICLCNLTLLSNSPAVGRTLHNLNLYKLTVKVIRRPGGQRIIAPPLDTILAAGDTLVLTGPKSVIEEFEKTGFMPLETTQGESLPIITM